MSTYIFVHNTSAPRRGVALIVTCEKRYGDEDYAAPSVAPVGADSRAPAMAEVAEQEERAGGGREARPRRRPDTTAQGKMEKSFLSFR